MAANYSLPEGWLINSEQNRQSLTGAEGILNSYRSARVVEGMAISCSNNHDLSVDMNGTPGIIPRDETAYGITEGKTRDIAVISRVGKPVCCVITGIETDEEGHISRLILSRRIPQEEALAAYIRTLAPGCVIPAVVTRVERFGIFVDIGRGLNSFISLENISVSRIPSPNGNFSVGQSIFAVVTGFDDEGRICLSHKELLGTWEENIENFAVGQTVVGIIRGIESYGIFIELAPNLSGLAEAAEGYYPGDFVTVYIKNILPSSMKIKLVIIDKALTMEFKTKYYITSGRLNYWEYSPVGCKSKRIFRIFDEE